MQGPLVPATYPSTQKTSSNVPASPTTFTVFLSSDGEHLDFTLGQVVATSGIAGYKVYFAPQAFTGSPTMPNQAIIASLFKASNVVFSVAASSNNTNVTMQNRLYLGNPGWFFAVSYSSNNIESVPTNPIYNPSIYGAMSSSAIPEDVSNPEAYFESIVSNGKSVLQVTVSAKPPTTARTLTGFCNVSSAAQSVVSLISGDLFYDAMYGQQIVINSKVCVVQSVDSTSQITLTTNLGVLNDVPWSFTPLNLNLSGFQVYIQNYLDNDPSMSSYSEGPFFALSAQALSSGLIEGQFLMEPDAPPVYSVGSVDIVHGSISVYLDPSVQAQWNTAWAGRRITVIDGSDPSVQTVPWDYLITNVFPSVVPPQLVIATSPSWKTTIGAQYAIYPWVNGTQTVAQPHKVRLYFVAVSLAGTRRPDVLNSPYVEFPFGFTSSLPLPIEPTLGSYTIQGVTASLSWTLALLQDPTISHFNVYRQRVGTVSHITATARPTTPIVSIPYDTSIVLSGTYSYTDRDFITDPTSPSYDFLVSDPGVYVYYITTVNVEGTENPFSYAGYVSVSGTTITQTSGDPFQLGMVGETIFISGVGYEVKAVASPTSLTVNSAPTSGPAQVYTMGCVIIVYGVIGNNGTESGPDIYLDNVSNRLYNSDFYTQASLAGGNVALGTAELGAYGVTPADGQIPWANWNPNYKTSGNRMIATPATVGSNADAYTIWEYMPGGSTIPAFMVTSAALTGEILLADSTLAGIIQIIDRAKFLADENLVLQVNARQATISGSPGGLLYLSMQGVDVANSVVRWNTFVSFPALAIPQLYSSPNAPPPFVMISVLWKTGAYTGQSDKTVDATCTYTFSGTTGTWVSGDQLDTMFTGANVLWAGQPVSVTPYTIASVGSGTVTFNTAPPAGSLTFKVTLQYDHVAFAIYTSGIPATGGNSMTVAITRPMVNGGRLPANWTDVMNSQDWPGGAHQGGAGGGYVPPVPCVVGETLISTVDGLRPASELKEGDEIISWESHPDGISRANKITRVHVSRVEETVRIFLKDGAELHCSPGHLIAIWHGRCRYVEARTITVGETIMVCTPYDKSTSTVVAIETLSEPRLVYNWTLEKSPHNYVANGILSHNKPKDQYP